MSSESGQSKETPPSAYKNALRGVSVEDLTYELYNQLNLPEKIRGVVVTNIDSESPAITKLTRGNVILEINREAIVNTEGYETVVSKIKHGEDILLLIFRSGSALFITVRD